MVEGQAPMKASAEEYHFHYRMLDPEDLTAFAELAEWIYDSLVRKTKERVHSGADETLIEEAVGIALLEYNDAPQRYDPNLTGLLDYLAMAAYRDYLNSVAKEKRRAALSLTDERGADLDIVDDTQDIDRILQRLEVETLLQAIDAAFSDPTDRQIVALLLDGVRAYHAYAEVLGITHLPRNEQDLLVKRAKDRLLKRLHRIGDRFHG